MLLRPAVFVSSVWLLFALGLKGAEAQVSPPYQASAVAIGEAPAFSPTGTAFSPSTSFTIEAWVFLTAQTPYAVLACKSLTATNVPPNLAFALWTPADGDGIEFGTSTGAADSFYAIAAHGSIPLRTWTHVAAVLDGTQQRLYINGILKATGPSPGGLPIVPDTPVTFGRVVWPDGRYDFNPFPGYVRQLRFWNLARTETQIQAALSQRLPTDQNGLIAAWPLDETAGSTLHDISGAARHLTCEAIEAESINTLNAGPFFEHRTSPVAEGRMPYPDKVIPFDFDHDGDLDLIVTQLLFGTENRLPLKAFRNDPGVFTDVTEQVLGTCTMIMPSHQIIADFNKDGFADLFITAVGPDTEPFPGEQSRLLLGTADGRLVDATTRLPQHSTFTHYVAVADIDGDGDLDIYMANINGGDATGPRFYLNDGNANFSDATDRLPSDIANRINGLNFTAAKFVDINSDGSPDLVLGAAAPFRSEILINNGHGFFSRNPAYTIPLGANDAKIIVVEIASADFNLDGKLDLLFAATKDYVEPTLQLLLGQGNGVLLNATATAGFKWTANENWIFRTLMVDLNQDGLTDIAAVENTKQGMKIRLFINQGTGRFLDSQVAHELDNAAAGLTSADFDGDGLSDVVMVYPDRIVLYRCLKKIEAMTPPSITTQPTSVAGVAGGPAAFSLTAVGADNTLLNYQWFKGGTAVTGATGTALAFPALNSAETGIYDCIATGLGGDILSSPVIVGVVPPAGQRTAGNVTTRAEWQDIHHPNGAVYDQFLLSGASGTFTAGPGKIARCSYLDENDSIVQVEMSGAGAITINLDNPSGPMAPGLYNQSGIQYMKGKATIILAGADETTHFTIYSVGTATNPGVTRPDAAYAGWADIAVAGILSTNGGLGGIHQGNANYNATVGYTGLYAPNTTAVGGLVVIHGIEASSLAQAYLFFGTGGTADVKIAGSSLAQPNADGITVRGLSRVTMGAGQDSCGRAAPALAIQGALVNETDADVTAALVVGP